MGIEKDVRESMSLVHAYERHGFWFFPLDTTRKRLIVGMMLVIPIEVGDEEDGQVFGFFQLTICAYVFHSLWF